MNTNLSNNKKVAFCAMCPFGLMSQISDSDDYDCSTLFDVLPIVNGDHVLCKHGGYVVTMEQQVDNRFPEWKCPSTGMAINDPNALFR